MTIDRTTLAIPHAGIHNFVLRGSSLRNTDFIVGLVVYVGSDTKIMKSMRKS
jgi:magnesium-transporting ATPase (P-type)